VTAAGGGVCQGRLWRGESVRLKRPMRTLGESVRLKRLMRTLGASVRLKRPMRTLGGSVRLKRPMRTLGESVRLKRPMRTLGESVRLKRPLGGSCALCAQSQGSPAGNSCALSELKSARQLAILHDFEKRSSPQTGVRYGLKAVPFASPRLSSGFCVSG